MTYELAKELKDARFPQRPHTPLSIPRMGIQEIEHVDLPTLSELVEACGEGFESLARIPNVQLLNGRTGEPIGVYWYAYPTEEAYTGDCVVDCCGYKSGTTPEEAVARLWLALNKK